MWQKPKPNCKTIVLQLKKNLKKIRRICRASSAHKPYFNFKMHPWSLELITWITNFFKLSLGTRHCDKCFPGVISFQQLWKKKISYDCSHFVDEKTEAQGGQMASWAAQVHTTDWGEAGFASQACLILKTAFQRNSKISTWDKFASYPTEGQKEEKETGSRRTFRRWGEGGARPRGGAWETRPSRARGQGSDRAAGERESSPEPEEAGGAHAGPGVEPGRERDAQRPVSQVSRCPNHEWGWHVTCTHTCAAYGVCITWPTWNDQENPKLSIAI